MRHRHSKHNTQRQRLLAELKAVTPHWLPLSRVMELGGPQYNARIFELRALGYRIESKPGGGWFRLLVRIAVPAAPASPPANPDLLFPDPDPAEMRHRDDG